MKVRVGRIDPADVMLFHEGCVMGIVNKISLQDRQGMPKIAQVLEMFFRLLENFYTRRPGKLKDVFKGVNKRTS